MQSELLIKYSLKGSFIKICKDNAVCAFKISIMATGSGRIIENLAKKSVERTIHKRRDHILTGNVANERLFKSVAVGKKFIMVDPMWRSKIPLGSQIIQFQPFCTISSIQEFLRSLTTNTRPI